jgi:hypothetical protein
MLRAFLVVVDPLVRCFERLEGDPVDPATDARCPRSLCLRSSWHLLASLCLASYGTEERAKRVDPSSIVH